MKNIFALFVLSFLLCGLILFWGCNSDKRLNKQAGKFHVSHPDICDSLASVWYPTKSDTVQTVKYLAGTPTVETNTEYVIDTQVINNVMLIHDTVRVTEITLYVDTLNHTTVIRTEDSAKIKFANEKTAKAVKESDKWHSKYHNASIWALIVTGILALILVLTAFKMYAKI